MNPEPLSSVVDRHVIITGASGDIGRAVARYLGQLGAQVGLLDIDADKLRTLRSELDSAGIRCAEAWCDVTNPASVQDATDRLARELGPAEGLFNNAGYQGAFAPVQDYPVADFERVLAVNVTGAFNVLRTVSRQMAGHKGGAVVNMASMAATGGPPNMVAYAASKAAVLAMTRTASKDLAPCHIRVNAISPAYMGPGMMWTRQVNEQAHARTQYFSSNPEEVEQQMIDAVPMRRTGRVEEITGAVEFLLSERASYITGVDVPISGGIL